MDAARFAYLDAMGIVPWVQRREQAPGAGSPAAEVVPEVDDADAADAWQRLQAEASQCTACVLHETRNSVVFGVGHHDASLLLIGEGPGAEEDRQGEPFVGAAGQLLNAMLAAIGLERAEVYIANMVKCRPPGNRDPRDEEVAACAGFLARQVELLQPRVIVVLGRVAAQHCLGTDAPLGRLRSQVHRFGDTQIPVIATYHPAYLLRKPSEKRKSWQDLKRIRELLDAA